MKKYSIISIVIMLLIFLLIVFYQRTEFIVSDVFAPNKIGVDFNKNGYLEENETYFVKQIQTFDLIKPSNINLSEEEKLEFQYLSTEFAKNLLKNKKILIKNEEIIVENEKYIEKYNNSPFALKNSMPVNKNLFQKELEKLRKNPLKIYNNKSHKYHCLSCKYGKMSRDYAILSFSQLPKEAKACKFCSDKTVKQLKIKEQSYPLICSKGSVRLFLTDLSTKLKPDSNCQTVLCKTFLEQINSSKTSIDIAIYGYDNIPKITTALKNAVNRGVNVRLVYDTTAQNQYSYEDTRILTEFINQNNSDFGSKKSQNALMHNKFYIFDKKIVMTGSANLSKTDMSGFNSNSVVLINSEAVAKIYTIEFEQMFSGKFHTDKTIKPDNVRLNLGESIVSIYFSPQSSTIKSVIIPLINKSSKYIYIPSFLITHDALAKSLIDAKNRQVNVKIILDATNIFQKRSKAMNLRQNKIGLKCENYAGKVHSKSIIIDDRYIILGSMNFSNSGENKNDENVVIIENSELAKFYREFFEYLWKKIPDKYLKQNVGAESINSIGSCNDGIDNDFDGKVDLFDLSCNGYKALKKVPR